MKPRRTALVAALGLGVVGTLFVAVLATRAPAVDKQSASPLLGKPAPDVAGRDLRGTAVSLHDLQGRFVVVNFFASWCIPCHQEHPELQRFLARHGTAGDATVLGVICDDTAGNARSFVGANGGGWPVIDDPDGQVALDYGVRGPPESFLIAPSGIVLAKFVGPVTADGLDRLITTMRSRA